MEERNLRQEVGCERQQGQTEQGFAGSTMSDFLVADGDPLEGLHGREVAPSWAK